MSVFTSVEKFVFSLILCFLSTYSIYGQDTYEFNTPGEHTFTIPENVNSVKIEAWGAGGEGGFSYYTSFFGLTIFAKGEGGGGGAYSQSTVSVLPGDVLQIYVGAGGGDKGNGRGGKQRGDSTFVSSNIGGSPTVLVLAKGGLAGDGALTQSNPNDGRYLRGGQADEGIGDVKYSGGNGSTYGGSSRDDLVSGGGGGAAGTGGDGSHAGSPTNDTPGSGSTGGGDGGAGVNTPDRNNPSDGGDGDFPGGGGGGAKNGLNNTTYYGGRGGHGQVIITTYMTPLNIVLKDIFVKNSGLINIVSWETAHEDGGDSFEVERSANGKHFEKISFIPAKRNNHGNRYTFIDENALPGINYYRLKLVNVDGSIFKSGIVSAVRNIDYETWELAAYPNPVSDLLNINISGQSHGAHHTTIVDMSGKIMYEHESSQPESLTVNMMGWPSGMYMVQSANDKEVKSIKVNKQ
ncbi:MAG: T9SS type A sorting domain-containing protein [Saprospiraceae bacterium]|nr:T9SS type A sorting domain-containing protein [Saprospiraceae bacterium]